MAQKDAQKIDELLTRGVAAVYPSREAFEARLKTGKRMRLYFGIDPTSEVLHIGHAIGLRKLRAFQDLGHEVILLIGSFTAMIGDPTDKTATRTALTKKQVLANAATYKKQASKILRMSGRGAAKIVFNHKWLGSLTFNEVIDLASHFTVQQMLERDMFEKRMDAGKPIHLHEFLYPLMQGYDSVAMNVEAEVGGSDQIFNMLAGRTLMSKMKGKEKFVMATKLLENDEGKKMSKSEGGLIALTDAPEEMFGKIMAMSDSMILPYFEIATDVSMDEIEGMRVQLKEGVNPRDLKERLAITLVEQFHSKAAARKAQEHFVNVFRDKSVPEDLETFTLRGAMTIVDVLVASGLVPSKGEARRQIAQKAVKIDGVVVTADDMMIEPRGEVVLQKGKRHFIRLISK